MDLPTARYKLLTTTFNNGLSNGLAAIGRPGEALDLIDRTIGEVENSGDVSHMPELLRTKAAILLQMPDTHREQVNACFEQALSWSRVQGALS
ncbi:MULTISPECIES: hypothetical protein [unclassified Rhizobium]|uniref:hypothetical protein n=1 Tax=unclassified Rhizobium TaxID=2613769 RepID=UPI001131FEEC|nr:MULTISPECIES: hypothetical protein [unclassified Rhizobium]